MGQQPIDPFEQAFREFRALAMHHSNPEFAARMRSGEANIWAQDFARFQQALFTTRGLADAIKEGPPADD